MKRTINRLSTTLMAVVLIAFLCSCASMQDRTMTPQQKAEVNITDTIKTKFTSFHPLFIPRKNSIKRKAYQELLKEAKTKYGSNVDVGNIIISGSGSGWETVSILGQLGGGFLVGLGTSMTIYALQSEDEYYTSGGHTYQTAHKYSPAPYIAMAAGGVATMVLSGYFQKITVTGDVISQNSAAMASQANLQKVYGALNNAVEALIADLPQNSTIAILNVSSDNQTVSEYVIDELEYKLVDAKKFRIVDRRRIDQIRSEQNFQASGDVDDNSAVSIGNMLGASIVITGNITGSMTQRLVLRALDVKTAQIITMVREQF